MKRTLTLVLTASAVALGAPAVGHAATFCVNDPSCVGTQKSTPQQALDAAALNNQADTVHIGAKATPYAGGLSYTDSEQVTILGAGPGQTVVETASGDPAFLTGNTSSRLEDVGIRYSDATPRGLTLGGVARGVRITYTSTDPDRTGLWLENGGLFENGRVTTKGDAVLCAADTSSIVRDSVLSGQTGVTTSGSGKHINVSRVTIHASFAGVFAGASVAIDNSVLDIGSQGDYGVFAGSGANVIANHLTIVGSGEGTGANIDTSGGPQAGSLQLSNSIVRDFEQSVLRWSSSTPSDLIVRYSAFDPSFMVDHGPGTLDLSVGNIDTPPELVPSSGFLPSYRVLAPSNAIDAGDPGDVLTQDRAGDPRKVDGDGTDGSRSDMGAFEYQRQPPNAAILGPTSAAAGDQLSFSGSPSNDPDPGDKLGFDYAWDFGDGGSATGPSAAHAFATGGTQSVTLTVTDPSGLTDTASAQVQVSAPAQPSEDDGPPSQPSGDPAGTGQPAADATAPLISGLGVKGRRKRGRIRYRLSEDASVTLRLKRRGSKRVRKVRVTGRAGANTARLPRRGAMLPRGRWRLTALALDAAGNRSARVRLRFRVR